MTKKTFWLLFILLFSASEVIWALNPIFAINSTTDISVEEQHFSFFIT